LKNDKPYRASVSGWRLQLLDIFIEHYRPVLLIGETSYLFPHRRSHSATRHRQPANLALSLKKVVREEIGLPVRHHLWRKIMGGFLLRATNDIMVLRYALGHSDNSQSTKLYVDELRSLWASRKLDEVMTERMSSNGSTPQLEWQK